jgi:hypothetical protein
MHILSFMSGKVELIVFTGSLLALRGSVVILGLTLWTLDEF